MAKSPREAPMDPAACTPGLRLDMLRRTPLFRGLSDDDLDRVNARCRASAVVPGDVVHREGEPADRLFVVATGAVKLVAHDADGHEVVRDLVAPGEMFGTLQALGDDRHADEARALRHGCLLVLSAEVFRDLLHDVPGVALAALELTAGRLREARGAAQELATLPVERRLAATLLRLAHKVGEWREEGLVLDVALSQQDLAAMVGTTPESVSRTFRGLREAGLLAGGRSTFVLPDPERLRALARDGAAGRSTQVMEERRAPG